MDPLTLRPFVTLELIKEIIKMKLIIFGPPLAGKGTQAKLIAENLNIPHISAGQLLRDAVESGTTLGAVVGDFMAAGKLVPDNIIIQLINTRLENNDCKKGYILDGFPRTLVQAEKFHKDHQVDKVINITVDDGVLVNRIVGRRTCRDCGAVFHVESNPPRVENKCDLCGHALHLRSDDREDILMERLKTYHGETKPVLYFYRSMDVLIDIEGDQDIDEIYRTIMSKLK